MRLSRFSPGVEARIVRAGWGLGDQAFTSLANFAVGIVVARFLGPEGFGAFALAFATYVVLLSVTRAVATEPLVIRYSASQEEEWRAGTRSATGVAGAVGVAAGLALLMLGLVLGGRVGGALQALGICLPAMLVQDAWRYAFFARGRPRDAFVNDVLRVLALGPALAAAVLAGTGSVFWPVFAWGGSAAVGAIAGVAQARALPRLARTREWIIEHKDLGPRFLGEALTISGAQQLGLFGIAGVAGLGALGAFRAGQLLLGPLHVLFLGIPPLAVPEAVRMLAAGRRIGPVCAAVSVVLSVCALLVGAIWLLLPTALGLAILDQTWEAARPLVVPITLAVAGAGFHLGALIGLRALAAARRSMQARMIMSAMIVLGEVSGAAVAGAVGAAWASAAMTWLGALVWWQQFHRAEARSAEF